MKNNTDIRKLLLLPWLLVSPCALAAPGTPNIAWMETNYDAPASYTISWNMWWGVNGNTWRLKQNGNVIHSASLTINGSNAQSGNYSISGLTAGNYDYVVSLCNGQNATETCTDSAVKTIIVAGDSGGGEPDPTQPNPLPKPGGGYTLTQAEIDFAEESLTSSDLFQLVKASIATRSNDEVEAVVPGRATNPANVKRIEAIIDENLWQYTFAERHVDYSYTRFLRAVAKFSAFCGDYSDGRDAEAICRKSLATMFAHFTQETGGHNPHSPVEEWRQGLVYLRELGCTEEGPGCEYNAECSPATWQGQTWVCGKNADGSFKKYFGRGAKQLSYNYNYGPFSQAMFNDTSVLLNDPDRVARTWLNLASAVFFFVYPQPPKPSMLHVIDETWEPNAHDLSLGIKPGFGATTNIINGGIECNTANGQEKQQSQNRINYYQKHTQSLNVVIEPNEELGCANQGRFDTQGAGAMLISLDQDWSYHADMPEGKSFRCKLVGYQTAYSALIPGDYQKCVEHHFDVEVLP